LSASPDQCVLLILLHKGTDLDALTNKLQAEGATVLKTFNSEVFSGLSIQSDNYNADSLLKLTQVSQAWPVSRIRIDPIKPEVSFSDDATAANYSVHQFTGVQKAHDAGIFGKGAVIAVVDSGIDYTHPAVRFSIISGLYMIDWPLTRY
jgi:subtilisin family serine protease